MCKNKLLLMKLYNVFVYAKFCGIEFTYFYFQVNPSKNSHFIEFQSFNWDPKSKGGQILTKSPFWAKIE